jgi:CYTH domain-containing protein/predicted ATPase
MKNRLKRIVLTGGPCGGKTTAFSFLRQKLEEKGYFVVVVPEAATIAITSGLNPTSEFVLESTLQTCIANITIGLENALIAAAEQVLATAGDKYIGAVVLFDRGLTDGLAYTNDQSFARILETVGLNLVRARDERCDAVFHLVTAADGAEEFYTLGNNAARFETAEQAREKDRRTRDVWVGHPHMRIIDNSTDFAGKLKRLYQEICIVLGIPVPIECERKFLVRIKDPNALPNHAQRISIEQIYIASDEDEITRIRKRGQHGFFCHYQTIKMLGVDDVSRPEIEWQISEKEYEDQSLLCRFDTEPVHKTRTCFFYDNQYFELDTFPDGVIEEGCHYLELELTHRDQVITFPDYIEVVREVTGEPGYSNFEIAKRLAQE